MLDRNNLVEHVVSVELYEYKIDFEAEAALEKALDARKLHFHKSDRQWLNTENLYMVVYTFNFIEKRIFYHGR